MFPSIVRPHWRGLIAIVVSVFYSSVTLADLSFQQALDAALKDSPLLQGRKASVEAAQQSAIPAAALPDPKLSVGIDNLPIEGSNRFNSSADFMTMRQIGVMQEFPNRDKRDARVVAAQGTIALSQAQLQLEKITLLRETAMAWLARRNIEQQLVALTALEQENQLLAKTISAQHAAEHSTNNGMVTDILVPQQEQALLEERRDDLHRRHTQAQAELRRWLGDVADQPLTGNPPAWVTDSVLDTKTLTNRLGQNPALALYAPMSQILNGEIAEAQAAKHSDWGLEVGYSQRGQAYEDMVSVAVTMDLPLFGDTRQTPRIAAKVAEREQVDAERAAKVRELQASLETDVAEFERLTRALERQRTVIVPLTEKKVTLIFAAWQGNKTPLTELVMARQERIDAELKQLDIAGERDRMAAQLYFTYSFSADDLQEQGVTP